MDVIVFLLSTLPKYPIQIIIPAVFHCINLVADLYVQSVNISVFLVYARY